MTAPNTPTPPAAPPAPEPGQPDPNPSPAATVDADDGSEVDDNGSDPAKLASNEAKKWRLKLRETEATLNRVRDGIVADIARRHLPDERLLYVDNPSDEFLAEDGTVDRAKVEAACVEAAKKFNIAGRPRPPAPNPQQGSGSGGGAGVRPSWAQALKDGRNQ